MAPVSIKTVLISESVDPRCRAILEENGIRVTEKQSMKKDELIAEIKVRLALCVFLHNCFQCQSCLALFAANYQLFIDLFIYFAKFVRFKVALIRKCRCTYVKSFKMQKKSLVLCSLRRALDCCSAKQRSGH